MAECKKYPNGMVVDGYWEIIGGTLKSPKDRHYRFTLKNMYNGTIVIVEQRTLAKIIAGKFGVSKTISREIRKEKKAEQVPF